MKTIILFVIGVIVTGIILPQTYAEEIPVQIKPLNDVDMMIFGTVDNPSDNPVSILVTNHAGDLILVAQVMPNDAGHFSLNVTKQGQLWDNTKEFYVKAMIQDSQATQATGEENYREGTQPDDNAVFVDFQALKASQAKCTILWLGGIEACSLQAFLTLGIFTSTIIGTVIVISMITLRRSIQENM